MPLTGDAGGLRRLKKNVESLGTGAERDRLLLAIKPEVKALLREEFSTGTAPDGSAWQPTSRGKPAMLSKKLPFAFSSRIDQGTLRFVGKTSRDMLSALHAGHTFAPRQVAAKQTVLRFNSRGRLMTSKQFHKALLRRLAGKKPQKRSYRVVFASAHAIRARVLPARPVYPDGEIPKKWEDAIARGFTSGMSAWAARAEK